MHVIIVVFLAQKMKDENEQKDKEKDDHDDVDEWEREPPIFTKGYKDKIIE